MNSFAEPTAAARFEVDDLLSGRSLARCATLEQARRIVRTMAFCWPGSEDEVVILPVTAPLA
jgi:hypothetical protein